MKRKKTALQQKLDIIPYIAVSATLNILKWLPYSVTLMFGRSLGAVAYMLKIRKDVVLKNLSIAFPEMSELERMQLAKRVYLNFGEFLGEWIQGLRLDESQIEKMADINDIGIIKEAARRGKGILICSAHFGNWELSARLISPYLENFAVIANSLRNQYLDDYWIRLHLKSNIKTIFKGASMLKIRRNLRKNGAVAMLIDQSARSQQVFVPFFGRLTSFNRGPALIAIKSGAAFISAFAARGKEKWLIELKEIPVKKVSGADVEKEIYRIMATYAEHLEEMIRAYPDHWFWFHNRWKRSPPNDVNA